VTDSQVLTGSSRLAGSRTLLVTMLSASAAYVLLTVLVAAGLTAGLDAAVRDWFRPGDVWGSQQMAVDRLVEGLRPRNAMAIFLALCLAVVLARRVWRGAVLAILLIGTAGAITLATKVLLQRPDPHDEMSSVGSFPSGHVLCLLLCAGLLLLLLDAHPRPWQWCLAGLLGASMAVSLLVQAAHWFTDVLASGLLGVATLALAALLFARLPPSPPPRARRAARRARF
jgi:membrane-associated phospholipid phosphatase